MHNCCARLLKALLPCFFAWNAFEVSPSFILQHHTFKNENFHKGKISLLHIRYFYTSFFQTEEWCWNIFFISSASSLFYLTHTPPGVFHSSLSLPPVFKIATAVDRACDKGRKGVIERRRKTKQDFYGGRKFDDPPKTPLEASFMRTCCCCCGWCWCCCCLAVACCCWESARSKIWGKGPMEKVGRGKKESINPSSSSFPSIKVTQLCLACGSFFCTG